MKTLIIDCNNLCYGSFYTFGELSHEEKKTGVIFGFLLQLLSLVEKFEANKFMFCWDSERNYRKIIYPESGFVRYGINRRSPPFIGEFSPVTITSIDLLDLNPSIVRSVG